MKLEEQVEKVKKNQWFRIIVLVVTIIASIGALLVNVKEINNFFVNNIFHERGLYKKIEKLNTGAQVAYFDKLIGKPVMIKPWLNKQFPKYKEYVYVNDDFFVKSIADETNTVLYYAVTTRKDDFNPKLPLVFGNNLKLGKNKMSDINTAQPESIILDYSAKFLYYHENYYYGGIGNYRYYLIGYSPSECCKESSDSNNLEDINYNIPEIIREKDKDERERKAEAFGSSLVPNTYGVISEKAGSEFSEQIKKGYDMGVDYLEAVTF
ncbi:ETEC_3214 domain-containing protein [Priestia megaterium]|uniref:ETEC_3214 domain-containing protein n=1 Tax=Priestia megaterium TaxID=1404 RepID=UPI001ADF6EDF|nr:ETEC_3214 domain-containing protein [Priestia megaterium]